MIEDGIHFGLDSDTYHADPALGSTDKKRLLGDPSAYWWGSPLNPLREEENDDTPAKKRGRAVHTFVLDGQDVFAAKYGRCEFKGNVKDGIAERKEMAEVGKEPMAGKDYDRLVMAGTIIRLNPHVAEAFSGGVPEVSIFWTEQVDGEPVRQKARLDYLKVRAVSDLKTHEPMDGISFEASCHRMVKQRGYHLQAQSYMNARALLPEFVASGQVFGKHDADWLKKVAAVNEFAFVFCFWASKGAPLTFGGYFSPGNPKLVEAQRDIDTALKRFVDFRREFGEKDAWIRPAPLAEFDPENIDSWWRMVGADRNGDARS